VLEHNAEQKNWMKKKDQKARARSLSKKLVRKNHTSGLELGAGAKYWTQIWSSKLEQEIGAKSWNKKLKLETGARS